MFRKRTVILIICLVLNIGIGNGQDKSKKECITDEYICIPASERYNYEAFPDICKLRNGNLMCVFYTGNKHITLPSDTFPRGGSLSYSISSNMGKSWSKPKILFDGPGDDRDPSITQLRNGRLICNFFSLENNYSNASLKNLGTWIIRGSKNGKRWKKPEKISNDYYSSSPVRQLSTGRLVLGLYTDKGGVSRGAVIFSDDNGRSWSNEIDIDNAGLKLDAETDIIELKDGSIYAIQRPSMAFSKSNDQGLSWSKSGQIGFGGHCPYLHRTVTGAIILAYRLPNTSMRISFDECKSWSENIVIDDVYGAYPSMVNLPDGSILISYYEEGANSKIRIKRFRIEGTQVQWLRID